MFIKYYKVVRLSQVLLSYSKTNTTSKDPIGVLVWRREA